MKRLYPKTESINTISLRTLISPPGFQISRFFFTYKTKNNKRLNFGNFIIELEKYKRLIMIDDIYVRNDDERIKIDDPDNRSYLDQKIEMEIHTISINKAKNI